MSGTDNIANFPAIPRAEGGRFAKGGPGRLRGARGKKSREALEQIKSFGPDAIEKLRENVASGERWAIEYVLDKILPVSRTIEFEGTDPDDVKAALQAGDITASEAKDVAVALAKLAEVGELTDLRARLEALEALTGGQKQL